MNKKKEIGKGLKALLANIDKTTSETEKKEAVETFAKTTSEIDISAIETNPFQPRIEFDNDELLELAKSIKVHGLIQPITVRSMGDSTFQLISGERRLRASKIAGLKKIPAYIRLANDQEMLEMALVENIQRSNLNAIEIAISYQRLMDECQLTQENLSDRVGKDRSTVANYMRLLKLPPNIQNGIKSNELSMGHARAIVGIEDPVQQIYFYKKTRDEGLSVRALEKLIKSYQADSHKELDKPKSEQHPEIMRLTKKYSSLFGSKVDISRNNNGKGQVVIRFDNDDQLNRIVDLLDEISD
ncbi:MAG TPA: ParB/RepB/Spo0J family partition protein [Saprospiraceae bacterium]|nr:ParB/RepB/Spo0J family partition protein [Saprospiraceae bacterium]